MGTVSPINILCVPNKRVSRVVYVVNFKDSTVYEYFPFGKRILRPSFKQTINIFHYFFQTNHTFGNVVLTFIAALFLCLLFESPIHGIEKILLRRAMSTEQRRLSKVKPSSINNNNSQSTVTDSIESAWLLKAPKSISAPPPTPTITRDKSLLKIVIANNTESVYRLVPAQEEMDKKWYLLE